MLLDIKLVGPYSAMEAKSDIMHFFFNLEFTKNKNIFFLIRNIK